MRHAIGVDLGGTSIKYALVDEKGNIHFENTIPSNGDISKDAVVSQLLKAVEDVSKFAKNNNKEIVGVGIGTPGIIDNTERIVLGGAENIKGWENLHLADLIEEKTNLFVTVANDANTMGIGETIYGAGEGFKNVVFVTVGTGIGGAVIIDGKLFNGFDNRGTELGHVPLIVDGKPCNCGSIGCLEVYASTSALVESFSERYKGSQEVDGRLIVKLFKENDPLAVEMLEQHCNYLGHGISGIINTFSPQRVIIGGGLSEAGDFYIEKVRKYAFKYAMDECAVNTEVISAKLGNKAGYIGAAAEVFSKR